MNLLSEAPLRIDADLANAQHYEVPAPFFQVMLGPRRKYSACAWPAGRRVVGLGVVGYAALVALAVRRAEPRDHGADALTLAACFPIMHGAWGAGFVASVLEDSWKAARAT